MRYFFLINFLLLYNIHISAGQWVQSKSLTGGAIMNDIIEFKGDLYLATDESGIYRSSDQGKSWIKAYFSLTRGIDNFVLHKDLLLAAGYGFIHQTADGDNWMKYQSPHSMRADMVSDGINIYLATEFNGVFKSGDDGKTWVEMNNEETSKGVYSIAKEGENIYVGGSGGAFFRTSDEGKTWVKTKLPTDYRINQLFTKQGSVYANGHTGIYKSDDGGANWHNISTLNTGSYAADLMYLHNSTLFVVEDKNVYTSEDDGKTWKVEKPLPTGYHVSSIFINENTFCLGFWGGGVMRNTRNIDQEWDNSNLGLQLTQAYDIKIHGDNIFVGTENTFVRTSPDEGQTWVQEKEINNFAGSDARSMTLAGDYVFIGQGGGGIHRRSLSGNVWERKSEGLANTLIGCLSSNKKFVFAGIADNMIFRSADFGESWVNISDGFTSGIRTIKAYENYVFAGTWDGIFLSENNGDTWRDISNGLPDRSIGSIVLINSALFVSTHNNGLYKSSDFGLTWEKVLDESVYSLEAYHNYIFAGFYGKVLMSSDFGKSWARVDENLLPQAYISAFGFSRNYILAGTKQYGHGIWTRHLHELMAPSLTFYSQRNDFRFRNGEKIYIESDQALKSLNGENIESSMLPEYLAILDKNGQEVAFTALIDESYRIIEVLIDNPVEGETYSFIVESVTNESGLSNVKTQSASFSLLPENRAPVLNSFSLEGTENEELLILGEFFKNAFTDEDGDQPEKIIIQSLPENGTLYHGDTPVS